uniref:Concanavalin A-like lectin/glucanases superfamily protein n=1 Tax=Candidatus Kentrum sp. SD TaxID=2126332 RepID=A0A450Y4K3_9GAMM|nr:MAG: Concanavalin A-like lectin/glucanases superfamily protein [Candidatus Kentron sp. SD]
MSNNTHSYKTFAFREEIGLDLEGGAGIVEDGRFGKCANLPNQTAKLALQENLSALGLDKPNFSLSIWIHLNAGQNSFSLGTATAKLRVDGEGAELVSKNNPVVDFPDADFPAGHWHYLAWVKTGGSHQLYLDGIKVGVKAANLVWGASDKLELVAGNPGSRAAHLKCYPRALSEAEVLADYYTEVPTATESFVEQYPVDLAIANMAGPWEGYPDNKLFIVDGGDSKVRQKIVLTNASGKAISLNATGKPDAAKDNLHFELRFRNATFSGPATYPKFEATSGWSIQGPQQNPEDGSWSVYILSKSQQTLAADETLEFPFEYVTADSALGSRGTQVALHYRNLAYDGGDSITGNRNKQVDILKVSGGEFPLVALHGAPAGVVCNHECGELKLHLYNRSDRTLTFSATAEFRFVVPTGGGAGDLAANHDNAGTGVGGLVKDTNAFSNSIFRWKPTAAMESGETVTLGITGCTPNAESGVAIIDVEYQGLEGYPDGKLVAPVTKTTRDLAKLAGGGNVGIGTDDPKEMLHIDGSVRGDVEGGALRIKTDHGYLDLGPKNSEWSHFYTDLSKYYFDKEIRVDSGCIGSYDENLTLRTAGTDRLTILQENGNVGIGTSAPGEKLEVNGGIRASNAFIGANSLHTDYACFSHKDHNTGTGFALVQHSGGSVYMNAPSQKEITFLINNDKKMVLDSSGNVGIGTTSPAKKLEVDGEIQAGIAFIGKNSHHTAHACFSHKDHNTQKGFALLQNSDGTTHLNAASGRNLRFGIDNQDKMVLHSNGKLALGSGTPIQRIIVGQVNGNGSKKSGSGFSSQKTSKGRYVITFDLPFSSEPVVLASGAEHNKSAAPFAEKGQCTVTVQFVNSGDMNDGSFTFIAIGV